jgi:ABC-type transport system involved in cytochrome c biogenesis permease component
MGRGAIVISLAAVIISEVLFGKLFRNFALKLLAVAIGAILYFIVIQIVLWLGLNTNLLKLLSALIVGAGVRSGLFSVLMLPVVLPVFLPAIRLTEAAFGGTVVSLSFFGGIVLYDMILSVAASILFDYLWYAE